MSRRYLILLVAAAVTVCSADAGMALENDYTTVALWHMDSVEVINDTNAVDDDDAWDGWDTGRNHVLDVADANLVSPGYDGIGKGLEFALEPNYPAPSFGWEYSRWHGTFKLEGYIATDQTDDRYIFATDNQQIVVWQHDADADTKGEIEFSLKTAGDSQTHTLYAEMADGNDWQYVECSYTVDANGNGTMKVVTDVDNVSAYHAGAGLIAPDANTTAYLGNYDGAGRFEGRMDEIKLSAQPVPASYRYDVEDGPRTWAVWHMDSTETLDTTVISPDDDSAGLRRDNYLTLELADLVAPGYDGAGKCLQFNAGAGHDATNADPRDFYIYSAFQDTFKFEGWISEETGNHYIFATYDQIGIMNYAGEIRFYVLTWPNGIVNPNPTSMDDYIRNEIRADYLQSGAWQHITTEYSLNTASDLGTLSIQTDVETVVVCDGNAMGPVAPDESRVWAYLGSHKKKGWTHFHGRMDEIKISHPLPYGCGNWSYYDGDFNRDCYVDVNDIGTLAEKWLATTDPAEQNWQVGLSDSYLNYNIPFTSAAPTIDGVIGAGEWTDAKAVEVKYPEIVTEPQYGQVNYQRPTHEDLTGLWYFKWDNTYLYLAAEITDDVVWTWYGEEYPTSTYDYLVWGLNLYKDANDPCNTWVGNLWRDYNGVTGVGDANNAVKAASLTAEGYIIEVAFLWDDFNSYSPTLNDVHRAAIRIADSDGPAGVGSATGSFLADARNAWGTAGDITWWHDFTLVNTLSCGDLGYLTTDVAQPRDCRTSLPDFAVMSADWMECTDPDNPTNCDDLTL